jgi:hypothetical protein
MNKKLHLFSLTLGMLLAGLFFTNTALAVPFIIEDPTHGTCVLNGQNSSHYIYLCQDGAFVFIAKSSGGGNGGGGGGNDHCIICD